MNKKVLTLCAGVLLVGGSTVFTVNALNAGIEKVQTTYVAQAADEVAGYLLKEAGANDEIAVWHLIKNGENYYLAPDADGKWFLDLTDGQIKEVAEGNKNVTNVVLNSTTKVVSYKDAAGKEQAFKNGGIYLWSDENTQVESTGLSDASAKTVILGTADKEGVILDLGKANQVVASVEVGGYGANYALNVSGTTYGKDDWTTSGLQEFKIDTKEDESKVLGLDVNGTTFYFRLGTSQNNTSKLYLTTNKEAASALTIVDAGAFQFGGEEGKENKLYANITEENKLVVGEKGDGEEGNDVRVRLVNAKGETLNGESTETTVYLVKSASKSNITLNPITKLSIGDVNFAEESSEVSNVEGLSTALNTWRLEQTTLSILNKSLLYDGSEFSVATSESTAKAAVVTLAEDGQLQVAGQLVYMGTDGSLTTEAKDNQPAALYKVTEEGVELQPTTDANKEPNAQYIIAQMVKGEEVETAYVATEKEETSAATPGAEYGDEISVDADGIVIIDKTLENPKVQIPVIFKGADGKYLGISGGVVAWVDKEADAEAWVLQDGKLISVSRWQDDNLNRYFAGIGKELSTAGSDVAYVPEGILIGGETTNVTIQLAGVAVPVPALDDCELPIIKDVTSDAVLLAFQDASNQIWYVKDYQGNLTQNKEEADLWYVNRQLVTTDGRVGYTFESRQGRSTQSTSSDNYLTINGVTQFYGWDCNTNKALQLVAVNGAGNLVFDTTTAGAEKLTIDNTGTAASVFGMYRSPLDQFTAQWLVHRYGSSFQLNFKDYATHANKTWIGNVFDNADLVPVAFDGFKLTEITPDNDWREGFKTFLLKDRNTGFYIVLHYSVNDPNYSNTDNFIDGGYPFTVLSESNVLKVIMSPNSQLDGETYYPYFRINYVTGKTAYKADGINEDNLTESTPIECIEVGENHSNSKWYDVAILRTDDTGNNGHVNLFVTVEEHCAVNPARRPNVSFVNADNIVHGQDATNNPLNYRYVNIEFEAASNMQYLNEDNKYVNLDGKVLGLTEDSQPIPSEPNYFLADKAEGQWAVSMTEAGAVTAEQTKNGIAISNDTRFTFTNRENGASIAIKSMHALGNDVYAVEYESNGGEAFGGYAATIFGRPNVWNRANRDTLIIKAAKGNLVLKNGESAKNMDSYANWTKEQLQDKTFQLSVDAAAQLYVTENEAKGSHFLGLTADAETVTNWRLVPMTEARVYAKDGVKYLTQGTDSVYTMSHPHYFKGGKVYAYNDTTAIIAYALQNIENNEYLTYDPSQNQTILSMICDPNSKNFSTSADLGAAYRFVLKEKAEGAQAIESGKYNIIGVTPWGLGWDNYVTEATQDKDGNKLTGKPYYKLNLDNKLYGASTNNAIQVKGAYEEPTAVDIFTIATTASLEYAKKELNDKIRIYSAEDNDYALYEDGQFLNMSNASDIAPAMVIDTAYVNRPGNNRYQYLLVVNPEFKDAEYDNHPENEPVQKPVHMIKPDTMKGRFLVNQIDEAVAASKMHNNPYINDVEVDEKEVKLAFKWGYRTQDKLFLTDGQNGPVIEEIELGTADFNKAKFAFKYVNQAVDETFKVQTAFYDYDAAVKAGSSKAAGVMNNEGYLKSVNGVIVVTNGYTHGEEFLMAPEESAATANESIAAEGAISVTATDGAVIIKGAEGKNVVIATILGKVVANETVNSDNETIAVPAGIAVVSVDGESFKVVVK